MRFRLLRREKGAPRRPAPVPEPPAVPVPPRAAELENPYGRYYGTARSREDRNAEEVLPWAAPLQFYSLLAGAS